MEVIDLALFDQPGGKQKLATQLYSALKNIGKLGNTKHYTV